MSRVIEHHRPGGSCPYLDFLSAVEESGQRKDLATIRALVGKLREKGYRLLMTQAVKRLSGDLYELRPGPYRLLFYWDEAEGAYVLLNGFRKKGEKTPKNELELGNRLMTEHKAQRRRHE